MKVVQQEEGKKKPFLKAQDVFKIVACLVVIMWSVCIKDLFKFREYLQTNQLFYITFGHNLWYVLVSFIFMITTKYGYYALMKNYVDKNVLSQSYEGESRNRKLESILKLSYDSIFYLFTSTVSFYLFREEPWFPDWVGGSGKCQNSYMDYPSLPSSKQDTIEIFYYLQLGVHLFSVFEMMVIKRKTELKYYEKLLHHILAASLIAFSAVNNEILVGIMILFTHDFSDVFMAFGRTYVQTKFKKTWYIGIPIIFSMVFWWIYMRIIVFPLCLISTVGANDPLSTDPWYMSYYPHKMLHKNLFYFFACTSIFVSVKKKSYVNQHETGKQKQKLKQQQSAS